MRFNGFVEPLSSGTLSITQLSLMYYRKYYTSSVFHIQGTHFTVYMYCSRDELHETTSCALWPLVVCVAPSFSSECHVCLCCAVQFTHTTQNSTNMYIHLCAEPQMDVGACSCTREHSNTFKFQYILRITRTHTDTIFSYPPRCVLHTHVQFVHIHGWHSLVAFHVYVSFG